MSIEQKNGIYYAVIPYTDSGKQKHKWVRSGTSIKEAEKLERKLRAEYERGEITFGKKMTVRAFCDEWLALQITPKKAPATVTNYTGHLNNICKSIGTIDLAKLTARDIEKHYLSEANRGLSPTSIECQHATLRQALNAAVSWRLIIKNPAAEILSPPKRNKPKNAVYTPEQVQELLNAAQGTEMYLPAMLGFLVGLRRGEICGLRMQDIDLKNKSANIRHALDRMKIEDAEKMKKEEKVVWFGRPAKGGKTVLALGPLKTDSSEGFVPLPDLVVAAIKAEIVEKKKQKLKFGTAYKDFDFLWTTDDGNPQDPDHLYHAFQLLITTHNAEVQNNEKLKEADKLKKTLPMIRPHDMRHTHATLLLRKKIDIKIVSKKIRHKRASFTQDYYQHVADDMQSDTAIAMDELFTTKKSKKRAK